MPQDSRLVWDEFNLRRQDGGFVREKLLSYDQSNVAIISPSVFNLKKATFPYLAVNSL